MMIICGTQTLQARWTLLRRKTNKLIKTLDASRIWDNERSFLHSTNEVRRSNVKDESTIVYKCIEGPNLGEYSDKSISIK